MRVAIVSESFLPTRNGVTTSVCHVATELRARGHDVLIVAPGPSHRWSGIPVTGLPAVTLRGFPAGVPTPGLRLTLEDFSPDVLHAASPFVLGARALAWADRTGTPAVAIYQTDMPSYLAQHGPGPIGTGAASAAWRWIRRIHAHADRTLAPSRATLAQLREHRVPRTGLWRRGVDLRQFGPSWGWDEGTRALRRRLAAAGEVVVGHVGRLAPEKELWRLREVATIPGVRLVLVGDGPDRAGVQDLLTEAVATMPGRPNRLPVLLGQLSGAELARAYAAADIFVHTGTRETFGQTLQEAAATGLPVVAPARGGPLDLVDHGRTGFLFDPDRPGSLRACVQVLVDNLPLRRAFGRAGQQAVGGRTWTALTEELVGHYAGAVDVRRGRPALTPLGDRAA